ncbi:MAG: lytic transglycosylase domain-containing protein [Thermodesulfobacteriota bacterium]
MMIMSDGSVGRRPRLRMAGAGPLVAALGVLWCAAWGWAGGPKMSTAPVAATEIRGSLVTAPGVGAAAAMRESRRGRRKAADGAERASVSRRYPELIRSGRLIELVNRYSVKYGVDPRLVYSLIEQESRFNRYAVSPKGAQGLMQIMPDTQRLLGLSDPFDEEKNIDAGIRYLRAMLDRFETEVMALAAYNAGPEAVARHGGVPPFDETKDYVLRVVDRYFFLRLKYPSGNIGEIAQAETGL